MIRVGSTFSGYGGLDRAVLDVLGGEVVWHCEQDPAASAVLAHHNDMLRLAGNGVVPQQGAAALRWLLTAGEVRAA